MKENKDVLITKKVDNNTTINNLPGEMLFIQYDI
jgi:hypothetical protein